MAVIKAGDATRFLAEGYRKYPLILVFGPDEGAVRTRVRALAEALLGKDADPMNRLEFDAETLASDPARLLDEANAMAMFGGKRIITVSGAGKLNKAAWLPLLDVPPLDSIILFQADDLTKKAPIRVAFEEAPHAAALACYAPSRGDLQQMIDARAAAAGLSITPAARAYLSDLLGMDHALAEGEIEKLLLYCHGRLAIDVADIDAMIADSSAQSGFEPIDRAFEGKLEEIEAVALRSFREGINPSGLLVLALNHTMMLRRLAEARRGNTLDSALRAERIYFKREDRIRRQAAAWDAPTLSRAMTLLAGAQEQARRTPALDETVTVRALWSVALAARRR
jgi:DNA polymerase III subunit delta